MINSLRTTFITFLSSVSLISCGGGGGGSSGGTVQSAIEIAMPTAEPAFSTDCNEVGIGGKANYPASQWSSVGISWENRTVNGLSQGTGQTSVDQCLGWFLGYTWYYDCNAGWWANVPLEVEDNTITVTAVDSYGTVIGRDTITVNKPAMSFSIKGKITNIVDGMGLFNMKVTRDMTSSSVYTDPNGNYELKCLRSGTYTVAPDSMSYYSPANVFFNYMDWPFNPASRSVMVSNSDVIGQDFATEVYQVSGRVLTVSGGGFPNLDVFLTGSGNSTASSRTDMNGYYTLLAPNGTYTIWPSTYFPFAPNARTVTVNGSGVYNQDFAEQ